MAITCPKCGKLNPDNARFCWNDGEEFVTTGFRPFQYTDGSSANSIEDLIVLIEQNWDESKRYLYSDSFATWFSSIGRGDLTLAAQDIVQSTKDEDTALRKLIRRLEKNPTFRFSDGTKASTIPEFVSEIDKNWDEGKLYLYDHDDLADWLETIQRDDHAKTARQIISSESDQDIGLEKFLQSLGTDAPPKPQLTIIPATIDFGTVDADKVSKGGYTKQFTIRNPGRGHLYGTITSSESWIAINKTEFSGNSITITATVKTVGRSANITIQSNVGTETLPVKMNPVYPVWKAILSLECLIGAVVGLVLGYIVAYGLFISVPNPILGLVMGLSFGLALSMLKWVSKVQRPIFYLIPAALLMLGIGILTNIGYQEYKIRTAKNGDVWAVEPLTNALKGKKIKYVRRDAARILGKIGAVEPLINALKNDDSVVRNFAASALGRIGDARAVEPLIEALRAWSEKLFLSGYRRPFINTERVTAARALGEIGDARAVQPLINDLENGFWAKTRQTAAFALGKIGNARAVEPLIKALKDNDDDVRFKAADALGNIGDVRAIEPLINALKDNDKFVRWKAANALGDIGDVRAVKPLKQALNDRHVREAAKQALDKIQKR